MENNRVPDGVVSDGAERYREANTEEVKARRKAIAQEVEARYADLLAQAGPLRRWRLRAKMRREISEATDLNENLYLNNKSDRS